MIAVPPGCLEKMKVAQGDKVEITATKRALVIRPYKGEKV